MENKSVTKNISRREFFKPNLTGAKAWAAELLAEEQEKSSGPQWAMVIDLKKCIGCDTCTVACKAENRTPPGVTYNVVLQEEVGTFPKVAKVNTPRPCMQCDQPACGQVCPVKATYKMKNGIVAIDYNRCIGCRYCMVACPFGARYFDFGESYEQEMAGFNQAQTSEYGIKKGKREKSKAPIGVVRKCHFCFHRLKRGEEPACVETCLGDARYFGDLRDPKSVVFKLVNSSGAYRLKEYMATEPRVYYLK